MGQSPSRQKFKAGSPKRTPKPAPAPTLQQPVGISQTMSSRAESTTQGGSTTRKSTREESKTMSYIEGSISEGSDEPPSGKVCEKKVSSTVVVKTETENSTKTKTVIKDGVKTVMRFENGRLVAQSVEDIPLKLPDAKDKDGGKEKIVATEQPATAGGFPSILPDSFPTFPPASFPEVPPPGYPAMPEDFYPEYPPSSYPAVPPSSFPSYPPPSFPSLPPDMASENRDSEGKGVVKQK